MLLFNLLQICNIQNYGTKKLYWNCKILLKDVEESRGSGEFKIHDTYSETAKHAELWLYANLLHLIYTCFRLNISNNKELCVTVISSIIQLVKLVIFPGTVNICIH